MIDCIRVELLSPLVTLANSLVVMLGTIHGIFRLLNLDDLLDSTPTWLGLVSDFVYIGAVLITLASTNLTSISNPGTYLVCGAADR